MKTQECTAVECSGCGETKPRSEFSAKRKTRKCKQCEAQASHQRYLKNRDKVLASGAKRRKAKPAEIKAALADWYIRNREHVLGRCKEYNARPEVKERERKRQAARYAASSGSIQASRKAYYDSDPEAKKRLTDYQRKHYREHPEMYAKRTVRRRVLHDMATPEWADEKAINRIYRMAAKLTKQTGIQHHVDHIVPLQGRTVCGLHVETNLQVIPAKENQEKFNKFG